MVRTNDESYISDTTSSSASERPCIENGDKPPGVRRGEEFSQDTCKIWRKFEAGAAIGYHHVLRIASHSPIQAQIRIGRALTPTKI